MFLNRETLRQTVGTHAVHQAEVDGLGPMSELSILVFCHLGSPDLGSDLCVKVFTLQEGLLKRFIAAHLSQNPKLTASIICDDKDPFSRRTEGVACFVFSRNTLKVG